MAAGRDHIADKAAILSRMHGMPYGAALRMTRAVWERALREITRLSGGAAWAQLGFSDKAAICTAVVRRLLDEAGSGKRSGQ